MTLILHIGFPKCGTSYLQEVIWARQPGLMLIGPAGPGLPPPVPGRDEILALRHRDPSPSELDFLSSLSTEARLRPVIVSVESLVGDVFNGTKSAATIRRRLARVFAQPTVVLSIRRQDLLLKSVYSQYIHEGGFRSFDLFLQGRAPGATSFDFDAFKFDEVTDELAKLFGTDRVHVIPAELLSDGQFLRDKFRDIDLEITSWDATRRANASLPRAGLELLRSSNRLFRRSPFNPHPVLPIRISKQLRHHLQRERSIRLLRHLPGSPVELPSWARHRIPAAYSDSNRRLSEITGIDLSSLGYP